jgi:hypothetical protein
VAATALLAAGGTTGCRLTHDDASASKAAEAYVHQRVAAELRGQRDGRPNVLVACREPAGRRVRCDGMLTARRTQLLVGRQRWLVALDPSRRRVVRARPLDPVPRIVTSRSHQRRSGGPRPVRLLVVPAEPTYLCVDDGGGRVLFHGLITRRRGFSARRLRLNLGSRSAAVLVDGGRAALPPGPLGIEFSGDSAKLIPEGKRPCQRTRRRSRPPA